MVNKKIKLLLPPVLNTLVFNSKKIRSAVLVTQLMLLVSFLFVAKAESQEQQSLLFADSSQIVNRFTFGFSRTSTEYLFLAKGNYSQDLKFAHLKLLQNYNGTGRESQEKNFRDDQNFALQIDFPISKSFALIAKGKYVYTADSWSQGLNKIERVNGLAGFNYTFAGNSFVELSGGMENNKLVGIASNGPIANLSSEIINLDVFDATLNSKVQGEYLKLNYDRTNYDFATDASLIKTYDNENSVSVFVNYKRLNRDFFSPSTTSTGEMPIESRTESRLNALININFSILKSLAAQISIQTVASDIERSFKNEVENNITSKLYKDLSEHQLSFSSILKYQTDKLSQIVGLGFNSRNEKNEVEGKFAIDPDDLDEQKALEAQRDNQSSRTRFFATTEWAISTKDTIKVDYSVSLLQYDTPSNQNYDDRDEFSTIIGASYSHRFSEHFTAKFKVESQLVHLVFLKSQRSSMNNWNRVLLFQPSFALETRYFKYYPQVDLLANYTAYDYESKEKSINSYSFRQIAYKDSLYIPCGEGFSVQTKTTLRYFERGALFWSSFSESPQTSNFEQYYDGLFQLDYSTGSQAGIGLVFHSIQQKNLGSSSATTVLKGFNRISYGPQILIKFFLSNRSAIYIQGWYEQRYIDGSFVSSIPNITLRTNIIF